MKNWSRKKRWIVGIISGLILLPVIFYGGLFLIAAFNLFHAHEHCMKQTGLSLRLYARDHGGRFPFHTNGFGDAIVMLLRENTSAPARLFTAPGDDGTMLRECMKTGADVPENRCTRAYVQGLSESDDPGIAVVFDRYPTRGGDHFRRPWGPFQREVCFLDSSMLVVGEQKWSEFHRKQIELLVAAGISMTEAEKYYEPPVK